jgi:hypothetical protein
MPVFPNALVGMLPIGFAALRLMDNSFFLMLMQPGKIACCLKPYGADRDSILDKASPQGGYFDYIKITCILDYFSWPLNS